jgi:hypothetical protein
MIITKETIANRAYAILWAPARMNKRLKYIRMSQCTLGVLTAMYHNYQLEQGQIVGTSFKIRYKGYPVKIDNNLILGAVGCEYEEK